MHWTESEYFRTEGWINNCPFVYHASKRGPVLYWSYKKHCSTGAKIDLSTRWWIFVPSSTTQNSHNKTKYRSVPTITFQTSISHLSQPANFISKINSFVILSKWQIIAGAKVWYSVLIFIPKLGIYHRGRGPTPRTAKRNFRTFSQLPSTASLALFS